ncbi:hypothetical protein TSUD_395980 [Trifolium subterraneum]|uniref:Uncharacterized protein n=1 Tax=Trifolium subterraneum TaxID=3900 RepID=A0A2Z6N0P3_TRISU|nr:hypothetical protein TSUD_395980 [Trifolium subterraneum]
MVLMQGMVQMKFLKGFSADAKVMYEEASQVANDAVSSIRSVASFCVESKVMDMYRKKKCLGPEKQGTRLGLVSGIGLPKGEILKIPFEGVEIKSGVDAQLTDYVKKDFYYSLSRFYESVVTAKRRRTSGRLPEKYFWSAGNLPINERMIHYFLTYVLVPKSSNHASINDMEMQLLYAIKNQEMVNLNNELCYSMTVNDCEISTAVINRKMGVIYDSVGHTISYMDDEESPPPPQQPPHAEPTNQMLMDFMTQGFNQITLQFGSLHAEFGNLRQDMVGISLRMDRFEAFQRGEGHDDMNQD